MAHVHWELCGLLVSSITAGDYETHGAFLVFLLTFPLGLCGSPATGQKHPDFINS